MWCFLPRRCLVDTVWEDILFPSDVGALHGVWDQYPRFGYEWWYVLCYVPVVEYKHSMGAGAEAVQELSADSEVQSQMAIVDGLLQHVVSNW